MRLGVIIAAWCALLGGGLALARPADPLAWAFPTPPSQPATQLAPSPIPMESLPGSKLHFSETALHDLFQMVDWHPESHPAAPLIVRQGRRPATMACGYCHLPAGEGRPENAALAGLPAAYIARQIADMANESRAAVRPEWLPSKLMHDTALSATRAEAADAASYFARAKFVSRVRVVETPAIPAVSIHGYVYKTHPGAREALGMRIVEAPDDFGRFELRDASVGFTAFVPPGAVARGRALALTGGNGRTVPCGSCHGANFTGGTGPPLAGRFPGYIFRQLLAFRSGDRRGAGGAPMKPVIAHLTEADMIDLAGYVASIGR